MKKFLTALGIAFAAALFADGGESVLLWWLNDPDIQYFTEDSTVKISKLPFTSDTSDPDATVAAVRVRYGDAYLELGTADSSDRFDAYFMPDAEGNWTAGPAYAYFDGSADASTLFMIEIGEYRGDEWVVLAASETATREDLERFITTNPVDDPRYVAWSGGAYTVPEPSGGMLVLLGACLLALRRRMA